MVYLTKSNANRIIGNADLSAMGLTGGLYKRPIYFFNKLEYNKLLAFYTLYSNPTAFVEKYVKVANVDNLQFVWEAGTPAYHKDNSCERLNSDFRNIKIPEQIKKAGLEATNEFRKWFKEPEVSALFDRDPEAFVARMHLKFLKYLPNQPEAVRYDNSGHEAMENLNLEDLELRIDNILDELSQFISGSNLITRKAIVKYDKYTYCASKDSAFPEVLPDAMDELGITEDKLRSFLKVYEARFKTPTANLLKHYYRVKFNPDLLFEGALLDQLNLRKCNACFS